MYIYIYIYVYIYIYIYVTQGVQQVARCEPGERSCYLTGLSQERVGESQHRALWEG